MVMQHPLVPQPPDPEQLNPISPVLQDKEA